MFSFIFFLSSLVPLQVQCVPASSHSIPARRNLDPAQAPLAPTAQGSTGPLVMAYYPDWAGDLFPPKNIDFALFDWIDFAFATPDANFGIDWDSENSPKILRELVTSSHNAGTKVKLSIGGWTGSKYFSSAVSTDKSRRTFASNVKGIYDEFHLDGIDIDWEYPGREGNHGNQHDELDSSNFLRFLQVLRAVLPPDARITAAAQTVPFTDASGNPLKDVSGFANVLDWILLMNYDVWGSSETPGPNAPLSDGCNNSTQPEANAVAGFNMWTSAGFPANKLVLGLPSYGYVSASDATRLRQRSKLNISSARNKKPRTRNLEAMDSAVEVVTGDGESQVLFRELLSQGALAGAQPSDGRRPPIFDGAGGFVKYWDSCSNTPFLRSSSAGQVITYDDPKSLAMKTEFARKTGMLGVNIFDTHGDTDEWHLTDTVKKAATGLYTFEITDA